MARALLEDRGPTVRRITSERKSGIFALSVSLFCIYAILLQRRLITPCYTIQSIPLSVSLTPPPLRQMGNKTPGSASCGLLVVRVQLPGETASSTVLDVQQHHLDVRGAAWRLSLFLPHPVRETAARATWHKEMETLEIVLPVSRELDALNF